MLAVGPAASAVRAFERSCERVTVGTKNEEVVRRIISPVAVDVLDL
jgi:hypothetical protein